MIQVSLYESGNLTGRIGWDGSQYVIEPANDAVLGELLTETLLDPQTQDVVTSQEPDRFLNCLQYKYRSAYFLITPPTQT